MRNYKKTYISPKTIVIGIQTSSLLSESNFITTANKEYDGRSVLSRGSQNPDWEDD